MSQFLNKDGKLVSFNTVEELVAFIASEDNTNMDLKKGLANIANLDLSNEKQLIESGNKGIILDVIKRLFSAGGVDVDGNTILDENDLEIFQGLFGSPFNLTNTVEEDQELLSNMTENNWSFKYLDENGDRILSVVDIEGNVKSIEESLKYNESGEKIVSMIANPISVDAWLASDSSKTEYDYGLYLDAYISINALMTTDSWLASDSSVTDSDYATLINDFAVANTLLSEDNFKADSVLPENKTVGLYNTYLETYAIDNTLQTETEFLVDGSTNDAADYESNYLEVLAIDNSLQDIATWTADAAKVDATYLEYVVAANIVGFLTVEEWVESGYTSDTAGYYDYIRTSGGLTIEDWIISLSIVTREDYVSYVVTNGAVTKQAYLIANSNLVAEDYVSYVITNGAQDLETYLVDYTNLVIEDYPEFVEETDEDGLVYETNISDFNITNPLALVHLAGTLSAETQEDKELIKKELIIGILDNPNSPDEFVTPFLGSDDIDLLNKALVHPNTDITTKFDELKAIGTTDAFSKSVKLKFMEAIINKAQYIKTSTVLSHYIKADITTGSTTEINEKKILKKEAFKVLARIAIKDFMDTAGLPEVEIISDETIDSIMSSITITL